MGKVWQAYVALSQIKPGGLPQVGANQSSLKIGLQLFFGVVGALALLFVVIGGFRYVISAGNPKGAAEGKNTIIYAVVGLVIAISGEAIVTWLLTLI